MNGSELHPELILDTDCSWSLASCVVGADVTRFGSSGVVSWDGVDGNEALETDTIILDNGCNSPEDDLDSDTVQACNILAKYSSLDVADFSSRTGS